MFRKTFCNFDFVEDTSARKSPNNILLFARLFVSLQVIVDAETGVNYLFVVHGYAGGLTPLLDKNGKPVITPPNEIID